MNGSVGIAKNALALHPLVNSWSLAGQLLDDYMDAYGHTFLEKAQI
ncbi:MAG: hypothetical protein IJ242_06510 [Clostridia bacterium]|nr:hypothetical protein [Clostridia bacterium]